MFVEEGLRLTVKSTIYEVAVTRKAQGWRIADRYF